MISGTFEETKQTFELPAISPIRTNWHSPLFYLIKKIKGQTADPLHATLIAANTKLIADGTAYMLNIDSSIKHMALFPNVQYFLKERHYRIDQYYKIGTGTEHGLTAIHYTETYFAIHKGEHPQKIIIHVYLDINGRYLYSQVSSLTPLTAEQAALFKNREKSLKDNVNESKKLITALLNEKNARFMSAKTQADESEASLSELSRSISTPNVLKKYIETCNSFIQQVAAANLYNDIPDSRGVYIATLLPKLHQRLELLQKLNNQALAFSKNIKQSTDVVPDSDTACTQATSSNPIEALVKETLDNLSNYQKQIRQNKITYPTRCLINPKWEEISKTYPLILEIEQYLFMVICLPLGISKKNMEQITSNWSTLNVEIIEYKKYCLNTLAMSARNGNLSVFQSLFRVIEADIKEIFYEELINTLITTKKENAIKSIIASCEFLNNHSSFYRRTILKMSNENKYFFLGETLEKLNPEPTFYNLHEQQDSSILFKTYIEDNLQVFNMLLKHGANANTWGIRYAHGKGLLFTLLQIISIYRTTDYLNYIKLLLLYDGNPNIRFHSEDLNLTKLKTCIENKVANIRAYNKGCVTIVSKKNKAYSIATEHRAGDARFTTISETLLMMGNLNYSEGIRLLLPYSSIDVLVIFLEKTVNKNGMFSSRIKTHINPIEPWLKVEHENENKIFPPNIEPQEHPFMSYHYFIRNPDNDEQQFIMQENSLYIYATYALLRKKMDCSVLNNEEFDLIYALVFNNGIDLENQSQPGYAYARFLACDFLITMRISLLKSLHEQAIFSQKYIPILYPHLIKGIKKIYEVIGQKPDDNPHVREHLHILELRYRASKKIKITSISKLHHIPQSILMDYRIPTTSLAWVNDFPEVFELINGKDDKQHRDEIDSDIERSDETKENEERMFSLQTQLKLPFYVDTYFSEFLFIRPIFPLDYRSLKTCFSDANNMQYWGPGTSITGRVLKEQFKRNARSNLQSAYNSGWSIITHNGIAGCFWALHNDSNTDVEIAYILSPEFAGRGLATNAGKLILQSQYLYSDFIGKIIATVHPNNKASKCVLEKLGLKQDPERQNVPKFGSVRNYYTLDIEAPKDLLLYSFNNKRRALAEKQEDSNRKMHSMGQGIP